MNGLQISQFSELFERANKEDFALLLYDLYNYGFMAGYKQSEADLKAEIDKHIIMICTAGFWNLSITCL